MSSIISIVYIKEQIYNFWKQITTLSGICLGILCLYQRTNIQFLKANHNRRCLIIKQACVYIKEQIYNFWKQITTILTSLLLTLAFISKNKYTIFESKSQLVHTLYWLRLCLYQRTNIQFLKANHNGFFGTIHVNFVYIKEQIYNFWKQITTAAQKLIRSQVFISKNKYTIFESKSQRVLGVLFVRLVYIKEQIYNFWKQITTHISNAHAGKRVYIKEQIYNFWKQITTAFCCAGICTKFISKNKYTIFESKSQLPTQQCNRLHCLYQRTNIQFLKANHNEFCEFLFFSFVYIKEQIYNFWKQITTELNKQFHFFGFISKNKYTIFESKSQRLLIVLFADFGLYQRTNIQFLKANHNAFISLNCLTVVYIKEQIYNFWKQITTTLWLIPERMRFISKNKYTIFESKSQPFLERE